MYLMQCPQRDGHIERVIIDGHDSWACPNDAYAFWVDQEATEDVEEES